MLLSVGGIIADNQLTAIMMTVAAAYLLVSDFDIPGSRSVAREVTRYKWILVRQTLARVDRFPIRINAIEFNRSATKMLAVNRLLEPKVVHSILRVINNRRPNEESFRPICSRVSRASRTISLISRDNGTNIRLRFV